MERVSYKSLTASGIIHTGPCDIFGVYIGDMDGVNDPAFTIYDGVDTSGTEVYGTNTLDASALGMNGAMQGFAVRFQVGCYLLVNAGGGTIRVTVFFRGY